MKKSNFLPNLLVLCVFGLFCSLTNAQTLTRVKPAQTPDKPSVAREAPVYAQPAPGFNPAVGIKSNVPNFKTAEEKQAYSVVQKQAKQTGAVTNQPTAAQKQAEVQAKSNNEKYAKLQAYETQHLKGVDVNTPEGRIKRMQIQKEFYLANGDAATAAKIDATIKAATK